MSNIIANFATNNLIDTFMPEISQFYGLKLIWVESAKYLQDYMVDIVFNDGQQRTIDFKDYLQQHQSLFRELLDKEKFKDFRLDGWTLSWLDGKLDIAPERLCQI